MNVKIELNKTHKVIRYLMQEYKITESELARQTGLPQTTINRLLLGGTLDPRANTLKPIADFFNVTIGQLCGFEPIFQNRDITEQTKWRFVPIIEWDQVKSWMFTQKNITPLRHKNWIGSERPLSDGAFALYSLAFMEPRFRKNSILIIDPEAKYKDGHYVLVALDGIHPTVRKILMDGSDIWLQSFDQTQKPLKFNKKYKIQGTIIESRMDIYDE